jgi:3-phosphoshikimate 1-carboxyvinyltransferase
MPAIAGGRVRVVGFKKDSVQADARFPGVLEKMGCKVEWSDNAVAVTGGGKLRAVDADFRAMPDAAPTFAVVAAFSDGTSTLTGVENLRLKESDRMEAIAACLAAIGAKVETGKDFISVSPGALRGATIDPRGDHRIAMSFAVAGLKVRGVKILDPECVRKSLPHYFSYLRNLSE